MINNKIIRRVLVVAFFIALSNSLSAISLPVSKAVSIELVKVVYEKDTITFDVYLLNERKNR